MSDNYTIPSQTPNQFSVVDYVVMGFLLLFSSSIGVYYAIKARKNESPDEYLMAGKNMNPLPVSLSLLASFMSAVSLLGTPSEIYTNGTQFTFIVIAYVMVVAAAAHLYIPVFFKINATSSFEYLGLRFNRSIRLAGSLTMTLQMIMYMAIVLYAPSLALNAVTGLSITLSVLLIGLVCTFYTTIGGMKAVMWTDAFQIVLMFVAVIALLAEGFSIVDSEEVIKRNMEGKRFEFFNFNPSPLERHTVWTLIVGGYFTWVAVYGCNQAQVQRCLTVATLKKAQIALWINAFGLVLLYIILSIAGLIMYAYYYKCDPLSNKQIHASDQLIPLFVMDIFAKYKGLPGLFIAGIFSGTLSTISSGVNSLAAIILEDVIRPYICKSLSEAQATKVSKILALVFGLLCTALAFVAGLLGNILQAALSIFGMIGGPLLGVFTLGMFFPWANSKGALCGLISALGIIVWIGVGGQIYKPPGKNLPMSTEGCWTNSSYYNNFFNYSNESFAYHSPSSHFINSTSSKQYSGLSIYKLSYLWYSGLSTLIVLVIAHIVTFCTGKTKGADLDPKLIFPLFYKIGFFFPNHIRQKLLYGITYEGEYGVYSSENIIQSPEKGGADNPVFSEDLGSRISIYENNSIATSNMRPQKNMPLQVDANANEPDSTTKL